MLKPSRERISTRLMPDDPDGTTSRRVGPGLWMLTGAVFFALMGAFTHAIGDRCPWLLIALCRALLMFVTALTLASIGRVRLVVFDPPTLWQRSLAGTFSLFCNFYSMTRLPIGDALTLANTYPIWIVLATAVIVGRSPRAVDLIGVACGIVGVILMQRPELTGDSFAVGIALLGAVATCFAMLGLHKLKDVDPRAVVAHFSGVATLITSAFMLAQGRAIPSSTWEPWTLLMLLGVGMSGTVGQLCLTRAYASGPPTRLSVIGLSQVVFALAFDVLLWDRRFPALSVVGILLVLSPAVWLSLRRGRIEPEEQDERIISEPER